MPEDKAWMPVTTLLHLLVSRLIRHSPVAILSQKLKLNPSVIINYPSLKGLNASLMQVVKDFDGGKCVARGQTMLWVEKGRCE